MHFSLVDRVLEQSPDRIVTIKNVSAAEEYLQDHFPGFPVLPGVMMIEALVQAARLLLESSTPPMQGGQARTAPPSPPRLVLGSARGIKYGSFVRPGQSLRVEVSIHKRHDDGSTELKGEGTVLTFGAETEVGTTSATAAPAARTAVSGRFTLRPIRTNLVVAVGSV